MQIQENTLAPEGIAKIMSDRYCELVVNQQIVDYSITAVIPEDCDPVYTGNYLAQYGYLYGKKCVCKKNAYEQCVKKYCKCISHEKCKKKYKHKKIKVKAINELKNPLCTHYQWYKKEKKNEKPAKKDKYARYNQYC